QTATATARDSAGTVLTGRTVTWSVSSGTSLMVNASGVVTALAGGTESVVATVDGVKGAQALTVATVTSVAVSPKTGTALAPAQTRQFTTVATWSDQVTRPVSITYTATGGTISTSGLYTAGQLAGTFMVIANCACGRADTAAVSIVLPAQLTSLTISPKIATVNAGATQQFSAVANWSTGATTLPPITYSATGGVVSTTGLWTAPSTAGTYKVIVAHTGGTLKDTASVTVASTTTAGPSIAQVLFADGFESGDFTTTQNGVRWTSTPWVFASTAFPRTGSRSAQYRQGDSKTGGELRFGGLPRLSEVYLEFYLYQPSGQENPSIGTAVRVPVDGENDKFFRLWSGAYGSTAFKYGASTWGSAGVGMLGTEFTRNAGDRVVGMGEGGSAYQQSPKYPTIGSAALLGRWVRVRIRAKVASAANNDGIIQIWFDGTQVINKTNLPSYAWNGVGNYFEAGYLLGWANSGFAPGVNMYVDDVTISTGGFPSGL
ncbi:MAG: hypothetical protein P3C09_08150, partial [Gemmatimonadota bacterium]|nr:hypothetical protein [Gemmatimonadota bacterium]